MGQCYSSCHLSGHSHLPYRSKVRPNRKRPTKHKHTYSQQTVTSEQSHFTHHNGRSIEGMMTLGGNNDGYFNTLECLEVEHVDDIDIIK